MEKENKIQELTEQLEAGISSLFESEQYKKYLNTMSKFHNYSFNNSMLIHMQCPEASYVAGYESWKKNFDRQVQKGEKAIKIIAPAPYKKIEETPVLDKDGKQKIGLDGKPETEKVEHIMQGYKATSVFDISQTTGAPLPEICHQLDGSIEDYEHFKEALSRFTSVPIREESISTGANGYYSPSEKYIAIKEGMSEAQTIKTTLHEVAHSLLDANDSQGYSEADHRTKEVRAESVAYVVSNYFGIPTEDYSFGYIAGWSSGKDTKELKAEMETIQKTAKEMINGISHEMDGIRLEHTSEKAYSLSDGYLTIQKSENGYDFTLYDKEYHLRDGGQLDNSELRIDAAAKEALSMMDHNDYGLKEANLQKVELHISEAEQTPERPQINISH